MAPHTKRSEFESWIAERSPECIGETEYTELRSVLAPISESYLHRLLRESGIELDPMVDGVRQGSFDELQESLERLLAIYQAGDAPRRKSVRALVITAKDHARLAARSPKISEKRRAEKEEMALWLLTWLENPAIFPDWAGLRRVAWGMEGTGPES
jgi:hypothetical protein